MKTEKNILIAFSLNLCFSIIEFAGGIGYAHYEQNWYQKSSPWTLKTIDAPQVKDYFGVTRAGINLTYRFSMRRYDKEHE